MFARLVNDIRDTHVFSTVWTEFDWQKDLPALEKELIDAPDRAGVLLALCHLSNSLRDGHLKFTPCASADGPQDRMVFPMAFAVAGSPEKPHFILTQADRGDGVAPGDELITYDGVASAALLDHFRLELTGASPGVRLEALSDFLHRRSALGRHNLEGSAVPVQIRHGARVLRADPVFHLGESPLASSPIRSKCPARSRDLGSYELVDVGAHVCLYRASQEPFTRYALVRQTSFRYAADELPTDHERVQAFLAQIPGLAGVLLDLRDNGGGNAADEFLDWYAPGPYEDAHEWLRLSPNLTDRARLLQALRSNTAVDEYLRRAALGRGWWARPFDCGPAGCHDMQPAEHHLRTTTVPIALLLGPDCRSSCDMFAAIWTREHFGPAVGTPPGAMYTSIRYPLPVTLGDEPLGDFTIALCGLRFGEQDDWLEGHPLSLDRTIEPTWPSEAQDTATLGAAVEALRAGSFRGLAHP